ncbi:hypothetical protein [Oscillibacter sp.]|uniref:hypothetical protein n=1 Tax=Oscillibacter sp. TaxID=1945593 RepID=UPI00257A3D4A|nr:hypothetical protein [Oscillibacter sp.]
MSSGCGWTSPSRLKAVKAALSAAGNSRTCWTGSPPPFSLQDLCARYFTYARDGETHFVLFDDADTLSQKLRTGGNMGFAAAFLMYPEVQDLLPKLFPGRRT